VKWSPLYLSLLTYKHCAFKFCPLDKVSVAQSQLFALPFTILFSLFSFSPFSNASIPGYPFFGNITVTRSCEEECVTYEGIGSNRPTTCCYTDLCTDDAGSKGERSSSAALGVMAMVFGTLLQCVL
uniref:UPAR/Ly6 domain-containing protein n=1 Tax=Pavo cristatus TaxID=9049 RepID=A0A8C9FRH0_PAVCR